MNNHCVDRATCTTVIKSGNLYESENYVVSFLVKYVVMYKRDDVHKISIS